MIGISAISFALGLLMKQLGPSRTKTIRSLLFELNNLIGASFDALLQAMPVGMFCFMYSEALKMHSITNVAIQLGYFFSTVILCFTILLTIFYPTIMWLLSGQNCFRLYGNIIPAALVAIGTTSSAITLPMTMKCMEERERLSKRFTTTILPMGVTLNMNGTAMFYPMVAMFVAQMKSFDVGFAQMIVLTLFTIAMSMGFSGSPSTGNSIVNHIAFAAAIGIDNPEDILAFILPFEWIWSRVRTAINITGDCVIAKCIEGISNRNAKKISKMTNN
ncbi:Excitatory amino acid transporter 1 [Blomia tropicalis]|nr:Excitatory amino acid transporter 1 [Blomia tropicalis]